MSDDDDGLASPEAKRLKKLGLRVHNAVRMLKMGETAFIACDKTFPVEEVRNYLYAYAMHKEKWFDTTYDATTRVLTCTRAPPAPWDEPNEFDSEEAQ